jgi:phosphopantetheine--protein transferase-like protein
MILGIGIDILEINRFKHWHLIPLPQLQRIFSDTEITYCLSNPIKSAERFAVRFAAREAFYKALCQYHPSHMVPFLTLCKFTQVDNSSRAPQLMVLWEKLPLKIAHKPLLHLSLSHAQGTAMAQVIIEKSSKE